MNLENIRKEIDEVDSQLVGLYKKRTGLVTEVAQYKKENNLPVLDSNREKILLEKVSHLAGEDFSDDIKALFSLLMDLSKTRQIKLLNTVSQTAEKINNAVKNTPSLFPEKSTVACQGSSGAYSNIAAEKIFKQPTIMNFSTFDDVFKAVESGLCKYGVLPLENSTAGSVNKIYDLMLNHNFNIVRSTRIIAGHSLLAKQGVKLTDIKEVYSHEQAINQCADYLKDLNVKITSCENTAKAAEYVASSGRTDIAAICSKSCAEIYNLNSLADNIQDNANNYTRFICISKNPEIYPGADRTSIMFSTKHEPGSLYKIISKFNALNINILKLESRPIPDRDFEFMFYIDFNTSVYSDNLTLLLTSVENEVESFRYLGSYSEVL